MMKQGLKIAALSVLLGLAGATGAQAQGTMMSHHPIMLHHPVIMHKPMMSKTHNDTHPELKAAMAGLQQAKRALSQASNDFGGHRSKALMMVNQAISQVMNAYKFAKH